MYYTPEYKRFIDRINNEKLIVSRQSVVLHHEYEITTNDIELIFGVDDLFLEIINSNAFQRLKKIHFLGAIDYVVDPDGQKPNKRHTRFQHSLGVARLALQFSRERDLNKGESRLAVVSALLHDIGHAPLSHSLESVFKQQLNIGHHVASERIIKGEVKIGVGVHKILRDRDVNPFEVLATIDGVGPASLRELFSYSINIDTIEAILRSSTYVFKNHIFFPPGEVLAALMRRNEESVPILDQFWRLKDSVYSNLITNRLGVLADYICQEYMKRNMEQFNNDDYYITETELRSRHPGLFCKLDRLASVEPSELLDGVAEIPFVQRRFVIDENVELENLYSIERRYLQVKEECSYIFRTSKGGSNEGESGESLRLF